MARKYGTFFMAGFHPNWDGVIGALPKAYAQRSLPLLFGGRFGKQWLVKAAGVQKQANAVTDYNKVLVQYRDTLHELVMPCGEVLAEKNPDDGDIFA